MEMRERFRLLGPDLLPEVGATDAALTRLETQATIVLPADYLAFMRWSDGIEGKIGPNYVAFWPAGEIASNPYRYAEFVPGLLFFGGDGGAALFGFDTRVAPMQIGVIHADDLEPSSWVIIAPSFFDFWQLLATRDWIDVWRSVYKAR